MIIPKKHGNPIKYQNVGLIDGQKDNLLKPLILRFFGHVNDEKKDFQKAKILNIQITAPQ